MLVVCRTDKGRWSVRPADWIGAHEVETGNICEDAVAHIAIFESERNARQYAAIINACEERKQRDDAIRYYQSVC